jgi:hypothetical protein
MNIAVIVANIILDVDEKYENSWSASQHKYLKDERTLVTEACKDAGHPEAEEIVWQMICHHEDSYKWAKEHAQ